MKKFVTTLIFSFLALLTFSQVRVTSEGYLQVDYSTTSNGQSLTFGDNLYAAQPRGRWATEYWTGGLNFWIPWPNSGAGSYLLFLKDANGYIGINNGNPSYRLDVNGDIATYGTLRISSDERFKSNIKDLGNALTKVKLLKGVTYQMKEAKEKKYDLNAITDPAKRKTIEAEMAYYKDSVKLKNRYGFIAQEMKKVFPELVEEDNEGYLNIDYIALIPILVEAVKELQTRVETIENDCCNKSNSLKSSSISGENSQVTTAKLYQNAPNPFNQQTTIRFEIPKMVSTAQLYVCKMTGALLKTIEITQRETGTVTVNGNEFKPGMYLYSLITDGKIIDTKQMILTE